MLTITFFALRGKGLGEYLSAQLITLVIVLILLLAVARRLTPVEARGLSPRFRTVSPRSIAFLCRGIWNRLLKVSAFSLGQGSHRNVFESSRGRHLFRRCRNRGLCCRGLAVCEPDFRAHHCGPSRTSGTSSLEPIVPDANKMDHRPDFAPGVCGHCVRAADHGNFWEQLRKRVANSCARHTWAIGELWRGFGRDVAPDVGQSKAFTPGADRDGSRHVDAKYPLDPLARDPRGSDRSGCHKCRHQPLEFGRSAESSGTVTIQSNLCSTLVSGRHHARDYHGYANRYEQTPILVGWWLRGHCLCRTSFSWEECS